MKKIVKDKPKMRQLNRVPVKASKAQTICMAEEVASRASCYTVWLSSFLQNRLKRPKGGPKLKPTEEGKAAKKKRQIENRDGDTQTIFMAEEEASRATCCTV